MAIGYAKILSRYQSAYFEDWLSFVKKEFKLYQQTDVGIIVIDPNGQTTVEDIETVMKIFTANVSITIKFKDVFDQSITCDITCIDMYLVVEDYSMDELINDESFNRLYNCLMMRFDSLSKEGKISGFIFDRDGYSEDYINISH